MRGVLKQLVPAPLRRAGWAGLTALDHLRHAARRQCRRWADRWPAWHRALNARGWALTGNDRRIRALRDRHRGQRAFIVATGPSLQVADLELLRQEITFSCNKIYLAFSEVSWRPTYYSVIDVLVAKNNRDLIRAVDCPKIFSDCILSSFRADRDITWIRDLPDLVVADRPGFGFSTDLLAGAHGGYTVVYLQLQLAYYMGIREVYLLGLDFSFKVPPTSGEVCIHGEVLVNRDEVNHFSAGYRRPGETWTMPRLDMQLSAFQCAQQAFAAAGGAIYNASRHTALEVFPRVVLEDVLRAAPARR